MEGEEGEEKEKECVGRDEGDDLQMLEALGSCERAGRGHAGFPFWRFWRCCLTLAVCFPEGLSSGVAEDGKALCIIFYPISSLKPVKFDLC